MTLATQMVDVPLFGGIDQQTTPELVQPGRMLDVLNGVFVKRGAIGKRNGFSALSTAVTSRYIGDADTTWSAGFALATREDELLQIGRVAAYGTGNDSRLWLGSWSPAVGKWIGRDATECAMVTSESVVADSATALRPGVAYSEVGHLVYCWQVGTKVVYRVVDATTGAQIALPYEIAGSAPKVAPCGVDVVLTYISGNTLNVLRWDSAARAFSSLTTIALSTAEKPYDLDAYDGTRVVIGARVSGNVVKAHFVNATTGAVTVVSTGEDTTTEVAVAGATSHAVIAYRTGTPALRAMSCTPSGVTTAAFTVFSGDVSQVGLVNVSGTTYGCAYTSTAYGVSWKTLNTSGTVSASSGPYAAEWTLASKPWAVDGRMYAVLRYGSASSLHPTYIAARLEVRSPALSYQPEVALPVAALAPRYAGAAVSVGAGLASVATVNNTQVVALPVKLQVVGVSGPLVFATEGLRSYTLTVCGSSAFGAYGWRYVEAQSAAHFAGGVQLAYDGLRNVDLGFTHPPEGFTVTTAATGGSMGAGVYSYALVYAFTDAQGRIHRSAPSVPVATGTLTGSTNKATLTIPPLTASWKMRENVYGPDAKVEVYRTLASGATTSSLDGFYRVATIDAPASSGTTYVDTAADSTIEDEPQVYTAGGVLEAVLPPSHTVIAQAKNRVWTNSAEDPDVVWYSRELVPGEAPAFNESLTLAVPGGGPVTGIAALDSRVVVFKADRVFVVYGDGPNDQGVGGAFTVERPQLVTLGCADARSIAPTSDGIVFLSPQGLQMLTRSLEAQYVGVAVADWVTQYGAAVTSTVNLTSKSEVRLSMASGGAFLVWNTLYDGWTRWLVTDANGNPVVVQSSVLSRGVYYSLGEDGTTYQETTGYLDSGNWVTLQMDTPWVRLGSLQGYQRVRRALVLTERQTPYALSLTTHVGYDDANPVQSTSFTSVDIGDKRQVAVHIAPQTSQSIRFRIADSAPASLAGNNGQGAIFVGLSLEVGVKQGTNKLAAEARK